MKKELIERLTTLRNCCDEALKGTWDRSDAGFIEMRNDLNSLIRKVRGMVPIENRKSIRKRG